MALLVGRHVNKIDRKGRVSVPKPFRDFLTGNGQGELAGFYAYPLFKSAAIEACSEAYMARVADSIEDLDLFSEEQDDFGAVILESAHQLVFDPEGRVSLPTELINHAQLQAQVLFVGRGRKFQIWDPDTYHAHRDSAFERARARGATLKLRKSGEAAL